MMCYRQWTCHLTLQAQYVELKTDMGESSTMYVHFSKSKKRPPDTCYLEENLEYTKNEKCLPLC